MQLQFGKWKSLQSKSTTKGLCNIEKIKKREGNQMKELYLSDTKVEYLSMIELAYHIIASEKRHMDFKEVFEKIAQIKQWESIKHNKKLAQFYTDLNMDGRFVSNGSNAWGLKSWHRRDEINQEDLTVEIEHIVEEDDSGTDYIYYESFKELEE